VEIAIIAKQYLILNNKTQHFATTLSVWLEDGLPGLIEQKFHRQKHFRPLTGLDSTACGERSEQHKS
jgi:hypothetical protein